MDGWNEAERQRVMMPSPFPADGVGAGGGRRGLLTQVGAGLPAQMEVMRHWVRCSAEQN